MSDPVPPPETASIVDAEHEWHPVFLHTRREALVAFGVWFAAFCWTVPYCYLNGYPDDFDPNTLQTVWGIPQWVFYGVIAPWMVANLVTVWFAFGFIANDDLGEAHEGEDLAEDVAALHANDDATGTTEADAT